ncbi:hypothetical protein Q73_13580 [Bacillus coahuilensis m2-6]|uniref:efflux RND transporter periplasmic adaptor subunit n=1 Tax=Bacillus coahuilensis TaxID=408580 RepID=UPI0007500BC1|nr:hypothetical protein [Bacillus coahuilensis]KUP05108.1 hypothetical protein Q73_13580 [Bacillus coahuilensis m2-6]
MKRSYKLVTASLTAFVLLNAGLIARDDSSSQRTTYAVNWSQVKEGDVQKVLQKDGLVTYGEEHHLLFDQNFGSISAFLVKEGDTVSIGTSLFEYTATDYEARIEFLDVELERVEEEIDGIDDYIDELESIERGVPSVRSTSTTSTSDSENVDYSEGSKLEIQYNLKADIAEQEFKKEQLQAQEEAYEEEKRALEARMSSLTVNSDVEGIVETISYTLENPVITIVSADVPRIIGNLTEDEMLQVATGMKSRIQSPSLSENFLGYVDEISPLPEGEPKLEKDSLYEFNVLLNEEEEEELDEESEADDTITQDEELVDSTIGNPTDTLLPGFKVKIDVVTDEVLGSPVVLQESVVTTGGKHYVWILSGNGTAEKREVELGLEVGGRVAVLSGIRQDEAYFADPSVVTKSDSEVVTPLKPSYLKWDELKDTGRGTVLKHVLLGILQ